MVMNFNYYKSQRIKWILFVAAKQEIISGCVATIHALKKHIAASLTLNHMEILFYVFLKDGITRKELLDQIPKASKEMIQRYVKDLLTHELLTEIENENDYRYKHLHINEKGSEIIDTVFYKMQECATCMKVDSDINLFTGNGN